MYRAVDVVADPQVVFRKVFTAMVHPLIDVPMPAETGPAPFTNIPPAEFRPAPMPGQHTGEICHKVLAMSSEEIDRLIADGVLFTHERRPS
jgi:crotonobetainyl-CoA:carnitine CoA-transferase CaiB-like acyl-CoA transferase